MIAIGNLTSSRSGVWNKSSAGQQQMGASYYPTHILRACHCSLCPLAVEAGLLPSSNLPVVRKAVAATRVTCQRVKPWRKCNVLDVRSRQYKKHSGINERS